MYKTSVKKYVPPPNLGDLRPNNKTVSNQEGCLLAHKKENFAAVTYRSIAIDCIVWYFKFCIHYIHTHTNNVCTICTIISPRDITLSNNENA